MSDLPMTPVWGIHKSVISIGTSPGVFVVSRDEGADLSENVSHDQGEIILLMFSFFSLAL